MNLTKVRVCVCFFLAWSLWRFFLTILLGQTGWSVRESTSNGNGWYNSEAEDDDQDQDQDQENDERAPEGARLSRASSTHSSANNKVKQQPVSIG
jgi:hypothetical protein